MKKIFTAPDWVSDSLRFLHHSCARVAGRGVLGGLLLGLAGQGARAQAPAWQSAFAIQQGASSSMFLNATSTDASGNVYLVGGFNGTVTFGATTLSSASGSDVYVAKWSPSTSRYLWALRAGSGAMPKAVAVSGTSIYTTGYLTASTATFGTTVLTNADPAASADVFVAKITDAGTSASVTWALRAGGARYDYGQAIAVSGANVYVAGEFDSVTSGFGSVTLANASTQYITRDAFVAKVADAGSSASFVWAQRAGSISGDGASALAASGSSVYLGGYYTGYFIDFGSTRLASNGGYEGFVAKLTDAGATSTFEWAQRLSGPVDEQVRALTASGTSVYVAGDFTSPAMTCGSTTLTNADNRSYIPDVFVTRLTDGGSAGTFDWAQRGGSSASEESTSIAVSGASVYVTGAANGTSTTFGPVTAPLSGRNDVFVVRLTDRGSAGTFNWVRQAGGAGDDFAKGIAVSGTQVYVAGYFNSSTAAFGSFNLTSAGTLANPAGFLASLTDNGTLATAPPATLPGVSVSPNPAHGSALLELPGGTGTTEARIGLTDMLGRVVQSQVLVVPVGGLRTALPLTGLAPGLYTLRVQAGAAATTRQLAVE